MPFEPGQLGNIGSDPYYGGTGIAKLDRSDLMDTWFQRTNQIIEFINPLDIYNASADASKGLVESRPTGAYEVVLAINPGAGIGFEIGGALTISTTATPFIGGGDGSLAWPDPQDEIVVYDISAGAARKVRADHVLPDNVVLASGTTFTGDLTITGTLTINGGATNVFDADLRVFDRNIELAYNQITSIQTDGNGASDFVVGQEAIEGADPANPTAVSAVFSWDDASGIVQVTNFDGSQGAFNVGQQIRMRSSVVTLVLSSGSAGDFVVGATAQQTSPSIAQGRVQSWNAGSRTLVLEFTQGTFVVGGNIQDINVGVARTISSVSSVYVYGPTRLITAEPTSAPGNFLPPAAASGGGITLRLDDPTGDNQRRLIWDVTTNAWSSPDAGLLVGVGHALTTTAIDSQTGDVATGVRLVSETGAPYWTFNANGSITADAAARLATNFNADLLDGAHASATPQPNSIPVSLANGRISGGWVDGVSRVSDVVSQVSHGFALGQVLRYDGVSSQYVLAIADSPANAEVVGVVSEVIDANTFALTYMGKIDLAGSILGPLVAGDPYFLSPTIPGAIQPNKPTVPGQIEIPIILGVGPSEGIVLHYVGTEVPQGTDRVYLRGLVPVGTIHAFAGDELAIGPAWIPCDGRSVGKIGYPDLYAAIGRTYTVASSLASRSGDSSGAFVIPSDHGLVAGGQQRIDVEWGDFDGSPAARVSMTITSVDPSPDGTSAISVSGGLGGPLPPQGSIIRIRHSADSPDFFVPDLRDKILIGADGDMRYKGKEFGQPEPLNQESSNPSRHTTSWVIRALAETDAAILEGHTHDDRYVRFDSSFQGLAPTQQAAARTNIDAAASEHTHHDLYVRHDTPSQGLNDAAKLNARTNIGALGSDARLDSKYVPHDINIQTGPSALTAAAKQRFAMNADVLSRFGGAAFAMLGSLNLGGNRAQNAADGVSDGDLTTLRQLRSSVGGLLTHVGHIVVNETTGASPAAGDTFPFAPALIVVYNRFGQSWHVFKPNLTLNAETYNLVGGGATLNRVGNGFFLRDSISGDSSGSADVFGFAGALFTNTSVSSS